MAVGWSDKGQLPGHGLEPHGQGTVLRIGRPGCGATAIELHGISGLMVFPALHVLVCAGRGVVYGHGFLLEHPSPFHAVAGVGPGVVDLPFILGYMGGEPLRLGHGRGYRLVKPCGKERGFQGFPGTRAILYGGGKQLLSLDRHLPVLGERYLLDVTEKHARFYLEQRVPEQGIVIPPEPFEKPVRAVVGERIVPELVSLGVMIEDRSVVQFPGMEYERRHGFQLLVIFRLAYHLRRGVIHGIHDDGGVQRSSGPYINPEMRDGPGSSAAKSRCIDHRR